MDGIKQNEEQNDARKPVSEHMSLRQQARWLKQPSSQLPSGCVKGCQERRPNR